MAEDVKIATTGRPVEKSFYSIEHVEDAAHNDIDAETYSKNLDQHKRGLFFGVDDSGGYYFFDPAEVTDSTHHEYAIYVLRRNFALARLADTFWAFVTDV